MLARKLLLMLFMAIAGLTTVATVAWACVPFKGTLKITTTQNTGGTVTGDNSVNQVVYCNPAGPADGRPTVAASAAGHTSITVSVGAGTICNSPANKLAQASDYTVIINNATTTANSPFSWDGTRWSLVTGKGCFFTGGQPANVTLDTAFNVDTNGNGSGIYSLGGQNSVDATNYASEVCVGKTGGNAQGIIAPIRITAV